jgi:hypothetical protein
MAVVFSAMESSIFLFVRRHLAHAFARGIDVTGVRDAFRAITDAIGDHAVSSCFHAARF